MSCSYAVFLPTITANKHPQATCHSFSTKVFTPNSDISTAPCRMRTYGCQRQDSAVVVGTEERQAGYRGSTAPSKAHADRPRSDIQFEGGQKILLELKGCPQQKGPAQKLPVHSEFWKLCIQMWLCACASTCLGSTGKAMTFSTSVSSPRISIEITYSSPAPLSPSSLVM
jgi:hypothetical protein